EVGAMLTGEREGLSAIPRLKRLVAVGVEEIVEELHVELVVLDDQDGFRLHHRPKGRLRRFGRLMIGDLMIMRHGTWSRPEERLEGRFRGRLLRRPDPPEKHADSLPRLRTADFIGNP